MQRNSAIQEELKQLSELIAAQESLSPYRVPGGYFETLPGMVMAKIIVAGEAGINRPPSVPEGYFEHLPVQVVHKIRAAETNEAKAETEALSPLLAGLSRNNVYRVPEGYFENLQPSLPAVKKEAPVVSLFRRKIWVRYAAAAAILVALFLTNEYIINPDQLPESFAAGLQITSEEQFNQTLAQLSENEIYSYLMNTSDVKDVESMAALVDEQNLPTEVEYLDEQFLESYLQQMEKNNN